MYLHSATGCCNVSLNKVPSSLSSGYITSAITFIDFLSLNMYIYIYFFVTYYVFESAAIITLKSFARIMKDFGTKYMFVPCQQNVGQNKTEAAKIEIKRWQKTNIYKKH